MLNRGIYGLLALLTLLGLLMNAATVAVFSTDPFTPTPNLPLHVVESESPLVHASGSWTAQNTPNASGGSYLYSSGATTDVLEVYFIGTRVEVVYLQHPALGTFAIEIDTVVVRTVVATGETTMFGVRSVVDYLTDEPHILRVYPVSGVVAMDAFYAIPLPPAMDMFPEDGSAGGSALLSLDVKPIVYTCDSLPGLCIGSVDTLGSSEALANPGHAAVWSPDGSSILYADGNHLHLLDNSGAGWQPSASPAWPYDLTPHGLTWPDNLDWSPQQNLLAFSALENGDWGIFCLDLSDRDRPEACAANMHGLRLLDAPSGVHDNHPAWSPDMQHLAFETNRHDPSPDNVDKSIYLYELATHQVSALLVPDATPYQSYEDPAWSPTSPTGQKIALTYYPGGTDFVHQTDEMNDVSIIRIVDADNLTSYTDLFTPVYGPASKRWLNPAWSPDGNRLAYDTDRFQCIDYCPYGAWGTLRLISAKQVLTDEVAGALSGTQPDWRPMTCPVGSFVVQMRDDSVELPDWAHGTYQNLDDLDLTLHPELYIAPLIGDTGFAIYEAPVINAPPLDTLVTWNGLVCAYGRIRHETSYVISRGGSDHTVTYWETWYRISPDHNDPHWILASLQVKVAGHAFNAERVHPYIYSVEGEEWDVSTATADPLHDDPLADQTHPDFENPPDTIAFRYDRERAAAYASFTSVNNFEHGHEKSGLVIENTHYHHVVTGDTLFQGYRHVDGSYGHTGSGVFMSQSLWHGGIPMVVDTSISDHFVKCNDANEVVPDAGWLFCPEDSIYSPTYNTIIAGSSRKWRTHRYIIYQIGYMKDIANLAEAEDYYNSSDYQLAGLSGYLSYDLGYFKNGDQTLAEALYYYLANDKSRIPGSNTANASLFDINKGVRIGDYMYVQAENTQTNQTYNHGFLVVGWGKPISCHDFYTSFWNGYAFKDDWRDYMKLLSSEPDTNPNRALEYWERNFIPYVADFVLGLNGDQTVQKWSQYPGPRPFYCVLYKPNPSSKAEEDPNNLTFGDRFVMQRNQGNTYHPFYFYHLESRFEVNTERLYAPYFGCYYDNICNGDLNP